MHSGQGKNKTTTEKVMLGIAVGSVVFFAIVAYPTRNLPSGSPPNASVSAPAATPSRADPGKQTAPTAVTSPALGTKTAEVRPAVTARTPPSPAPTPAVVGPPKAAEVRPVVTARTPPSLAPTAAVRQITHLNAETMSDPDGSAHRRLVGKIALQIEHAVKWSAESDPELAGKADGAAALEAFYQAAKPFTAATVPRESKAPRAGMAEPPDQLKTQVQHIVTIDAADSFEARLGPEKCQAYLKAFQIAFNRDQRAQAGD
jgi:hypothetical protein